ncbi:UNVERIFIED_CONTAM: rRNA-processing protein and EBNA1-binding protein ebp2 [Siphonaria sp. JEL0065]|nr:rRNA-processing protein and EBNA1-binding protein ebp2 [Siphonaria sp. JEL0065]
MFKGKATTKVSNGQRTAKQAPKRTAAKPKNKESEEMDLDLDIDAFVNAQQTGGSVDQLLSQGQLRTVSKKKNKDKRSKKGADEEDQAVVVSAGAGATLEINGDEDEEMDAEERAELKAYEEIMKEQRKADRELKAIERLLTGGMEEDNDDDASGDDTSDDENKPKVFRNDKTALLAKLDQIRLDSTPGTILPWTEFQRVTASQPLGLLPSEVDNDLKREMAFYKQALEAAIVGYRELRRAEVPVHRPDDYYAEMIKSDEHMNLVRQKLVDEANSIAAAEKARKLRDAKKFGKKVQQEKLLERQKSKKEELDKVKLLRKKANSSKNVDGETDGDEFGIAVDKEYGGTGRSETKKAQQVNHKRKGKDAKFGFGGKKRHSKSNTAESSADISDFNGKRMKREAQLGAKKGSGVGKKAGGGGQRPGKARRQQQHGGAGKKKSGRK